MEQEQEQGNNLKQARGAAGAQVHDVAGGQMRGTRTLMFLTGTLTRAFREYTHTIYITK